MTSETRGESGIRGLDPDQCQQRGSAEFWERPCVLAFLGNILAGDEVLDCLKLA